jgi:hypothetical protein
MKLTERHDRYMISTATVTGGLILASWLFDYTEGWWWPVTAACLLLIGHSLEYKDLRIWPR